MKRMGFVWVVALGGALLAAAPAGAAPSERVSVTLSCDRGVSATAAVAFWSDADKSVSLGEVEIRCGGVAGNHTRVVVAGSSAVNAITVTSFDVVSDVPESCASETTIPTPSRVDCPADGRGARLVVR